MPWKPFIFWVISEIFEIDRIKLMLPSPFDIYTSFKKGREEACMLKLPMHQTINK